MSNLPALAIVATIVAAPGVSSDLITFKFRGGTMAEYVAAVRQVAGDTVNVIITERASALTCEPIELRQVSVASALALVDNRSFETGLGRLETDLDHFDDEQGLPVWRLDVDLRGQRRGDEAELSHVWRLTPALEAGLGAEDALSAVETALSLYGDEFGEARLRFHTETGLLIGRGHPGHISTIDGVLKELVQRPSRQVVASQEMQITELEAHNDHLRRKLIECETRMGLIQDELTRRQNELAAQRHQYLAEVRDLQAQILELMQRK